MAPSGRSDIPLVAMAVSELPVPYVPSMERSCARCGAAVWIDRNLEHRADDHEIVCSGCAKSEVAAARAAGDLIIYPETAATVDAWMRRQ